MSVPFTTFVQYTSRMESAPPGRPTSGRAQWPSMFDVKLKQPYLARLSCRVVLWRFVFVFVFGFVFGLLWRQQRRWRRLCACRGNANGRR